LRRMAQKAFPRENGLAQASLMEFLLEGLAQNFALSKFKLITGTRYADELSVMQKSEAEE